ncbi:MAG: glucose PTS transporter subunit IIA, partial [Propionibacteriaceae bacterium]|nr:glucose PTS transporter subunit IIA [Propionibacteriaceae bacterium]
MTQQPATAHLDIIAPLTGVMTPLEQVPDPVFARKMVGDGFSVDPLSDTLVAPVAGEVVDLQPSGHAVTVRTDDGLDLLMHIGLDTVALMGEGFTPRVKAGARVAVGDPLITFDLDLIAQKAKSLLTQVVVVNVERLAGITPATGLVAAGQSVAAALELKPPEDAPAEGQPGSAVTAVSEGLVVPNPSGLHARPAATLVALAKEYEAEVRLRRGDDTANAKSILAVMGLAVGYGQKIVVTAHGPDAEAAVAAIAQAVKDGLGEDVPPPSGTDDTAAFPALKEPAPAAPPEPRSGDPNLLVGVPASPGLAIGTVFRLRRDDIAVDEFAADHHLERRKLNAALDRALLDLSALGAKLADEGQADKAEIFAAHAEILGDPQLLDIAGSAIDKGNSAPYAWRAAYNALADALAALPNELLAGRAIDVRDVGQRVLEELTGRRPEKPVFPDQTIIVAEDLTPSDIAQLDRAKVVGFATTGGGASSHVAIIARSFDIPAVAGIEGAALDVPDGARVVLDGVKGTIRLNTSDDMIEAIVERQRRIEAHRARDEAHQDEPAETADGRRLQVVANIGGVADAEEVLKKGGEGVGLLRSEFVFMGRTTAPTEAEQAQVYADCARALRPGQPLVVRTLDVGGDKPLPYLPIPAEENPFLGMRGIRVGLERPDLLRAQLRAILAAADAGA